jgi:hypothetical protein
MRRWLADLETHRAGFIESLAAAVALMRKTADDPDQVEGQLREHLRQAADLVERLGQGQDSLIGFNKRMSIRFGVISILFLLMAAWNVAQVIFR